MYFRSMHLYVINIQLISEYDLYAKHLITFKNNSDERRLIMGIKPGPKRIAESTGKPDKRQRDNKETPKNNPDLKKHNHKKGD